MPEEIAYVNDWIDKVALAESAKEYGKSPYGQYPEGRGGEDTDRVGESAIPLVVAKHLLAAERCILRSCSSQVRIGDIIDTKTPDRS